MDLTSHSNTIRELDYRSGDGVDVTLFWDSADDRVFVRVVDERDGVAFDVSAPPAAALDVFRHPFAYASASTISIAVPVVT